MSGLDTIRSRAARAWLLTPLLCLMPFPGAAQKQQGGEDTVRSVSRFVGSAKLNANGGSKEARVTVRQISVPGKQRVDLALDPGFHLVTLRAGQVTTVINGSEEKHSTGDFWSLKENTKMSVTANGETAVLEVMSVVVR